MKPVRLAIACLSFALAAPLAAQSSRGRAESSLAGARILIDYGRPSLRGRDMSSLLPVGHVWRLGADEATRIELTHETRFGGVGIAPGAYSLFIERRGERDWVLLFNEETGQWGTQHDVTLDLAEVPLEWRREDAETEVLTIELVEEKDGGRLDIRWGREALSVRFAVSGKG